MFNLVSRRDIENLEMRHIGDSLSLVRWINGSSIADVGSGAGFPGIVLAIVEPTRALTLIERSEKKARFLRQVIIELDLSNVELVVEDAKSYHPTNLFDTVTARALARPMVAWNTVRHLLRPGGHALLQSVSSMRNLRFTGGLVRRSTNVEVVGVNRPSYVTEIERTQFGGGAVCIPERGR